ncbi:MAG: NapC/NirT family cytochrome c [Motiliproteus sp.]
MLKNIWTTFFQPSRRFPIGILLGGVAGIILWGGFNTALEATNSIGFCINCHEMEQTVYQEYKKSVHYKNRSGVRVTCADCHVPRAWLPKMIRKIRATNELYHKLAGSIDTLEKFEAKRMVLAERVWQRMESTDSLECRNCHDYQAMDFEKQQRRPREKHPLAIKQNETCIDCHKGIAHQLPEEYESDD